MRINAFLLTELKGWVWGFGGRNISLGNGLMEAALNRESDVE